MKKLAIIIMVMCSSLAAWSAERKPNIVLIMADDVSWECFPAYGGEDYQTPNIDALAAKGVRFANCFSTPICTPSRVKIMTGKYNFRNYTHFGYLNPKEKTFGNMMQAAGYKTAIAGKWQLNGLYNSLPGHDDNTRPFKSGFDEYCLWQLTQQKNDKNGGERFWSPPLEMNGKFLTKKDNHEKYGPDIMSDFICDFIDRNKDQPFFVYYPMVLVHNPFVPTPDTIGSAPRTHGANKQQKGRNASKANFIAMVNYMDKIVGKIVNKVDEIGQLDNTIILFTADNGTNRSIQSQWNGRTIKGGKGGMKDMGTHVPLVAYWKGHTPKGKVLEDLIDFTDFYPTLAEAAGHKLSKADPIDGSSFLPRLNGKPGNPRQWVLCHYQPYWGQAPGQFARTAHFKLYRDGRFYNVPIDLDEANDLAGKIDKVDIVSDEQMGVTYKKLKTLLQNCPPVPEGKGKTTKDRPTTPNWPKLEPGD